MRLVFYDNTDFGCYVDDNTPCVIEMIQALEDDLLKIFNCLWTIK